MRVQQGRTAADFAGWEADNGKFEEPFERLVLALRADVRGREVPRRRSCKDSLTPPRRGYIVPPLTHPSRPPASTSPPAGLTSTPQTAEGVNPWPTSPTRG